MIDLNNVIEVACTAQMKQEEERIRMAKISELEKRSDKLMLQIQWIQNREKKEEKKRELLEIKNLI